MEARARDFDRMGKIIELMNTNLAELRVHNLRHVMRFREASRNAINLRLMI